MNANMLTAKILSTLGEKYNMMFEENDYEIVNNIINKPPVKVGLLKKIKAFFKIDCNHRFDMFDVANLNKDPQCYYCNKKLSEINSKK